MASELSRIRLARAARALNAAAVSRSGTRRLPALLLVTDGERMPDPVSVASALPRQSGIVLRHRDPVCRQRLAQALMQVARLRDLLLLVAGDGALASGVGAAGLHLPEVRAAECHRWRARRPSWIITVAAHSERALLAARRFGADAALLAPLCATMSHPETPSLGVPRFHHMALRCGVPVYALGGVTSETARALRGKNSAGLAAVGALIPDQRA